MQYPMDELVLQVASLLTEQDLHVAAMVELVRDAGKSPKPKTIADQYEAVSYQKISVILWRLETLGVVATFYPRSFSPRWDRALTHLGTRVLRQFGKDWEPCPSQDDLRTREPRLMTARPFVGTL